MVVTDTTGTPVQLEELDAECLLPHDFKKT